MADPDWIVAAIRKACVGKTDCLWPNCTDYVRCAERAHSVRAGIRAGLERAAQAVQETPRVQSADAQRDATFAVIRALLSEVSDG